MVWSIWRRSRKEVFRLRT